MSCIPEVEELIGLATDNTVHKDDVGTHTLKVVKHVRQSEEYRQLGASDKELIELAAFFHDIGKGPKSRWIKNAGKQKGDPDHAIRSAEMLTRILSEEIGGLSLADAKTLLRLVCYHDLVGDIVAKGRDEKQLDKICKNIRVLTMLTALGKADMAAINPLWITMYGREISALQKRVCERMGFVAGA
jgi:putative nucleotidyltransferase with HDIG domain